MTPLLFAAAQGGKPGGKSTISIDWFPKKNFVQLGSLFGAPSEDLGVRPLALTQGEAPCPAPLAIMPPPAPQASPSMQPSAPMASPSVPPSASASRTPRAAPTSLTPSPSVPRDTMEYWKQKAGLVEAALVTTQKGREADQEAARQKLLVSPSPMEAGVLSDKFFVNKKKELPQGNFRMKNQGKARETSFSGSMMGSGLYHNRVRDELVL